MTKLFELHEIVQLDSLWLADSVDVISRQIAQHEVLRSVLFGGEQTLAELVVLCLSA